MIVIKCSPYEKGDFLRILDYAKQKKKEEMEKGKITKELYKYEEFLIDKLINRVNGHYVEEIQLDSKTYRERTGRQKRSQKDDWSMDDEMGLV